MKNLPADPVAAEIHAKFWRKMKPGGHIDQILNGGEPVQIQPPLPDEEIAVIKRSIDVQLDEYEAAIVAANNWARERRRSKGFRRTKR